MKFVKKVFSLLFATIMLFTIAADIEFSAYAEISGDYEYSIKNGTAIITKYTGSETDISIPLEIDGYAVTSIGDSAFSNCESIQNVIVPDGVTSIGERAFYMSSLTDIDISDSVISIGTDAFCFCSSLTNVKMSNNVESIGVDAFAYCKSLTSIIIPDRVTSISSFLFQHCEKLNNVEIPKSVTSIAASAFASCTSLTNITIPDSVTSIGDGAFADCSRITNISIPYGVQCINNYTFKGCKNLKSVTIPNSVTRITSYAFLLCDRLSNIYYDGTINEWNNININSNNEQLTKSTIFCSDGVINCKHNYNIVTTPATCTERGEIMYICEFCGDTYNKPLFATGHSYDSGKVTQAATCTADGVKTFTCTKCNATKEEIISATGHITVIDEEVPPICTEAGLTEGVHCSVCNYTITEQEIIPATGHSYDNGKATKKATCKATGVKTYTCKVCGKTKTETIAKTAHTYKTTTSKATTKANGSVVTKCSVCGNQKSKTTIYYPKTITLSATSYTYNGKIKTPIVTVIDSKNKKISDSNYTVTYPSGRKNVGTYKVTIKFKGNYSGTVSKTFTIKPKATTLSSVTAKYKGFTAKWKKQATQTTGYQLQYSTSSKFSNAKTVTVSKNKTTSKTISKLTAKKKYYVRIRTYKIVKVNGKSTKIYSSWSKAKSVTTKK
ncbi:MAG: leucine-rich repeat protein [Eubacterium sp.]|nr:leucine-rich repeat protein [Eubacterium sp.]